MNMNKVFSLVLIVAVFLLLAQEGEARRAIPDNNLSYPVLVKLDNKPVASGFYVDNHRSLYFVTARHVLFKEKVTEAKETLADLAFRSPSALLVSYPAQLEITTPKEIELALDHLHKGNNIKFHATQDIVAIKIGDFIEDPKIRGGKLVKFVGGVKVKASPGDLLTVDINSVKTFKDVLVGNDVYIFGYPSSLGIQGITQIDY